mmetsp:Transcript_45297/g.126009  ORF Transcript_45297/g.126009 Transcript_45297/m.126009 type:complete len:222 (+) Transcript_45297:806-1471(+)
MSCTSTVIVLASFAILTRNSSILSVLCSCEVLDFISSWSHQSLWLSSSFCSFISRKIIFSIMLMTWSKAAPCCMLNCSAKRWSALEWEMRAAFRRRFTALTLGSWDSWRKFTPGAVGGSGFSGGVVRTPVTFARILTATSMASRSCARTDERSSHSRRFTAQACWVWSRVAVSALRSSSVSLSFCRSWTRSSCTVPSMVSFWLFDPSAALFSASLACFARS